MSIGKCLGCNQKKILIESHIIPVSWLKRINPLTDNGKIQPIRNTDNAIFVEQFNSEYIAWNRCVHNFLTTDSNILCKYCDGDILGRYDNELYKIWGHWYKNRHNYSAGNLVEISASSDLAIKGIAAILWRASISKEIKCSNIDLGLKYNKLFHEFLFENKQLNHHEFSVKARFYLPSETKLQLKGRPGEEVINEDSSLNMPNVIRHSYDDNHNIHEFVLMLPSIWINAWINIPEKQNINCPLIWPVNENYIRGEVIKYEGSLFEDINISFTKGTVK